MRLSRSGVRHRVFAVGWRWLVVLGLVVLGGVAWGVLRAYHDREERHRHQVERELQAISQLQAQSVADWREQRLTDAHALIDDALLATALHQWTQGPTEARQQRLRERLRILEERAQYTAVYVVSPQGQLLLTPQGPAAGLLPPAEQQVLRQAIAQAEPGVVEPRHDRTFAFPFFSLLAPIFDGAEPVGAIWLVSDVRSTLYPLLTSWPTTTETAESVIVSRAGDEVLFLSPSHHQTDPNQTTRLPLDQSSHPAVQAVAGVRGVVYTHDSQNTPVIAMLRAVPDTPWYLVTTVALSEMFAEAHQREALALSLAVSLGLLCAGLLFAYGQRQAWQRELKLKDALQRNIRWLDNAQRAAAIGYFAFDPGSGRFTTSRRVTAIFGVPDQDGLTERDWVQCLHPEDRDATRAAHRQALAEDRPLRLQYRILRASDQAVRWVEVWAEREDGGGDGHRLIGTVQDITERRQSEDRLAEQRASLEERVRLDPLTNLANRRALDEHLATEWHRAMRNEAPLSLLMVDVDHFKAYNDHYGHLAGDHCLQKVAQVLAGAVARSGEVVARYGGEEFVVLLPETSAEQALTMARKIGAAVRARSIEHRHTGGAPWVTVSIGVATAYPRFDEPSPEREADGSRGGGHPGMELARVLFEHADAALYQAKQQGRNRAVAYDSHPG